MKSEVFLSGFAGAVIGAASLVIVTLYQVNQQAKLEKKQFESELILESIVKNSPDETRRNIRFLLESGFVSEENEKILPLLDDTTFVYNLPKSETVAIHHQSGNSLNKEAIFINLKLFSSRVLDEDGNPIKGAIVYTNPLVQKSFENIDSYFSSDTTDSQGIFSVALPFEDDFTFLLMNNGSKIIHRIYPNSEWIKYPEEFIIDK